MQISFLQRIIRLKMHTLASNPLPCINTQMVLAFHFIYKFNGWLVATSLSAITWKTWKCGTSQVFRKLGLMISARVKSDFYLNKVSLKHFLFEKPFVFELNNRNFTTIFAQWGMFRCKIHKIFLLRHLCSSK